VKSLLQSEFESTPLAGLESIGVQAIHSGQAFSPAQLAALVDKVTVDDVNRVSFSSLICYICRVVTDI